jgi:mono/diheme cytochrome c family protein
MRSHPLRPSGPLLLTLLLVGACGERDATPGLQDPESPDARQAPAVAAPPTDAPPTTPSAEPQLGGGLPQGVTAQMVQEGHRVYHGPGICLTCHGQDGRGTALGPALDDQQWLNIPTGSYEEIMEVVRTGVARPVAHPAPMPPMGGANLSDADLRAVAAYVYGLSRGVGAAAQPPAPR